MAERTSSLILTLTHEYHVTTHILKIVFHLVHLNSAIDRVLLQALRHQRTFLGRKFGSPPATAGNPLC